MESGNLRRDLKAKSHLSVENANLRAEIERLRAALQIIADGKGQCSICGKLAEGRGTGCLSCDCGGTWEPVPAQGMATLALHGGC